VARLAELANVVGIKEASGDLERIKEILGRCGDALDVYSGEDPNACDAILAGAKGVISVTANVAPKLMHEMCAAALAGDSAAAKALDGRLQPLHRAMFIESNPIPVKWAVHLLGLVTAGIRLPLTPLSTAHRDTLRQALAGADLL
jgi:4-hydroxy-tetrahydrodipicolinate synthase